MQNIFIEFLPPWIETGLQPAFYDKESGTILQQVSRMYAKMNELISVINKQNTVIEEYIQKFIELKDYVDDYFENLDVQEEINNKLDDMAEHGELAEIISAYLQMKAVLGFDTPTELKGATNLIAGSYAKTYGYKRKGDGVYDLYYVRDVDVSDINDNYNVIILTEDPTLVAIRLPHDGKRIIELKSTDNFQDYFDLECEKEIVFPSGTTTLTECLMVNSDTTVNLNGSTVNFNYARSQIFDYDWDDTLGFVGFRPTDTFTEWNGNHDITIKNGWIRGGCSSFLHSKNVLFESVDFMTQGGRHSIQFAGCRNFIVRYCNFYGVQDQDVTLASECINIDHCSYGGNPIISEHSPMWDGTKSYNVLIESNTFHSTTTEGLAYKSAVGTHGNSLTEDTICQRITIRNNDFRNPEEYAIGLKNYDNFHIYDNTMINQNPSIAPSFIMKRGSLYQGEIHDNVAQGIGIFFNASNPNYAGGSLDISSNVIRSVSEQSDSAGVFMLLNIHNSSITGNTIEYKDHAIHMNTRAYWDSVEDDPDDHTINLIIADNVFEKTTNQTEGKFWNIRMANTDKIKFINNQFIHDGTVASNWQEIRPQGTTTNLVVQNNNTDKPEQFMLATEVNANFSNNNALYQQSSGLSSTSTSGNFNSDIKNFSKIILSIGETTNTQNAILLPYLVNGRKFDSAERTLKWAVVKNDGTLGKATFTYNSTSTNKSWTYEGDIPLRYIWSQD